MKMTEGDAEANHFAEKKDETGLSLVPLTQEHGETQVKTHFESISQQLTLLTRFLQTLTTKTAVSRSITSSCRHVPLTQRTSFDKKLV